MSILLVDPPVVPGGAIAGRLVGQGDQVRVLAEVPDDLWRDIGAFVAAGDPSDPGMVEAAATGSRTIVGFEDLPRVGHAGTEARLVVVASQSPAVLPETGSYVVLIVGRRGLRRRPAVPAEDIALAVDAADDMAGEPRLIADLVTGDGWAVLGLERPL